MTFFLFIALSAFAGTEADLDECSRRSDAQLCYSKVLLNAIREGRPGGPGRPPGRPSPLIGKILFYRDDGRCSSAPLGQVFLTLDGDTNRRTCQSATATDQIWGYGVEIEGEKNLCIDISDTNQSSAPSVCENALSRSGLPK